MRGLLTRYLKYAGTSVIGSIADTLVRWLVSTFVLDHGYWQEYIISPAISFQCAVAVNFTISYFYVWKDRTRSPGRPGFMKLYLIYNLSNTLVFLLRLGVLLLIERFTGWDVVFCNLAEMLFSVIINFVIDNLVLFMKKKTT